MLLFAQRPANTAFKLHQWTNGPNAGSSSVAGASSRCWTKRRRALDSDCLVAAKPAFRDAWIRGQHCIIPGRGDLGAGWAQRALRVDADRSRRRQANGDRWSVALVEALGGGQDVHSFTMLTINADTHPKSVLRVPFAWRPHSLEAPGKGGQLPAFADSS
jgi:hypothetical protein